MNVGRISCAVLILAICFGCNSKDTPSSIVDTSKDVAKTDTLKAGKDLSQLSPEDAIKTKFTKLQFSCDNEIIAVMDGQNGSTYTVTKNETIVWDILEETQLKKKFEIKEAFQNILFNFASDLSISLDSHFDVSITGLPAIGSSTIFNNNITTVNSGGNGNQFIINESEKLNVFLTSFGPSSRQEQSQITLDCSLISEAKPEYK